jgi:hypothetical protein
MLFIGYYYSENGLCYLYKAPMKMSNWVSNIVYYDDYNKSLYSPNMKNLAANGRDAEGSRLSEYSWSKFLTDAHDSFVLK